MLIKKIHLHNFRSIVEQTLKTRDVFILLGNNGSGKSSFLYAVPFCFYGHSDWTLEDTLRWGAEKGKVEVEFSIQGKEYLARREFTAKSTSFSLYQRIDDSWVDIGGGLNKEAAETFAKVFPVPQEVFSQIVVKTQTEDQRYRLGAFCNATSKGMYTILKNFIEVIKFEKYQGINKAILRKLEDEKVRLESRIETSQEIIKDVKLIDVEPLKVELEELEESQKDLNTHLEESKELKKNIESWEEAQNFLEEYKDVPDYYQRWQKLKTVEKPEVVYDEKKFEESEQRVGVIKPRLEELEESIDVADEELSTMRLEYEELESENRKWKNQIGNLEEDIELLKEGECPTCNHVFEEVEQKLSTLEAEVEDIELHDLEPLVEKKDNLVSNLATLENLESDLTSELYSLEVYLNSAKPLQEKSELWRKKQEFEENYLHDEDPDELYRQYCQYQEITRPSTEKVPKIEDLEKELESLNQNYIDKTKELENIKHYNQQYQQNTTIIDNSRQELEAVEDDYKHHKILEHIYSRKGAPHFMIKDFLNNLQHYANQYLSKFTANRFSVEFKTYKEGRDNIDLILYDSERGNKPRPYSTLSQGEKTRVALSIEFLGLGKTFTTMSGIKIDTGLIDEVYGLDEEGQREFANILTEMQGSREIIGGVVCFESMAINFENIVRVENGEINY